LSSDQLKMADLVQSVVETSFPSWPDAAKRKLALTLVIGALHYSDLNPSGAYARGGKEKGAGFLSGVGRGLFGLMSSGAPPGTWWEDEVKKGPAANLSVDARTDPILATSEVVSALRSIPSIKTAVDSFVQNDQPFVAWVRLVSGWIAPRGLESPVSSADTTWSYTAGKLVEDPIFASWVAGTPVRPSPAPVYAPVTPAAAPLAAPAAPEMVPLPATALAPSSTLVPSAGQPPVNLLYEWATSGAIRDAFLAQWTGTAVGSATSQALAYEDAGKASESAGRKAEANENFRAAANWWASVQASDPWPWVRAGIVFEMIGRNDEALEVYESALKLPNVPPHIRPLVEARANAIRTTKPPFIMTPPGIALAAGLAMGLGLLVMASGVDHGRSDVPERRRREWGMA